MAVVNPVDRKEYLKKYLSGPQKSNSKKKKKVVASKSRIIDDDIDISKITPDSEKSDHELEDEAPVVAVVIDDRPLNIRAKEAYVTTHWKTLDVSSGKNGDNSNDGPSSSKRHDSSSDSSPPRKSNEDSVSKSSSIAKKSGSPSSRKRHDSSDSDISPPRNQGRTKRDSDSDISPPRRGNKSIHLGFNPKVNNRDSDSDLDLPRGRNQSNSSPRNVKKSRRDTSSSRNYKSKRNNDSDISPPRKRKISRQDSDSDISPPRIRPNADNSENKRFRNESRSRKNHDKSISKSKETLSGLKAGLQDAKALRTELQLAKKREEEMIKKIGEDVSGKNAETIFRDKHTGKRRNFKEEKRLQRIENEKKAKFDEKYMEWGKGLKQVEERENQLGEDVYEMSKPLARYADDEDLEKHLKEKEREGDPMLKFIKRKKEKQIDPSKVRPTYKGPPPPPNRFAIPPGYRWDGVDRSNGFEKKIFERQANKIAQVEEAYKWSVMDM